MVLKYGSSTYHHQLHLYSSCTYLPLPVILIIMCQYSQSTSHSVWRPHSHLLFGKALCITSRYYFPLSATCIKVVSPFGCLKSGKLKVLHKDWQLISASRSPDNTVLFREHEFDLQSVLACNPFTVNFSPQDFKHILSVP